MEEGGNEVSKMHRSPQCSVWCQDILTQTSRFLLRRIYYQVAETWPPMVNSKVLEA